MAVGIRSQPYHDPMASRRHRRTWLKRLIWGGSIAGVVAAAGFSVHHWWPTISKHFQKATIAPVARTPIGTWCRGSGSDQTCQFFDASGTLWGSALPSSGPLLLLINDQRSDDASMSIPFDRILAATQGLLPLGLAAKTITLPDAEPGGLTVTLTKGYDLYFDGLGNIADQLQVLGIFLADRAKDPTFRPQYIDLRTPGRVYYK